MDPLWRGERVAQDSLATPMMARRPCPTGWGRWWRSLLEGLTALHSKETEQSWPGDTTNLARRPCPPACGAWWPLRMEVTTAWPSDRTAPLWRGDETAPARRPCPSRLGA